MRSISNFSYFKTTLQLLFFLVGITLPTTCFADLPIQRFVKAAFENDRFEIWRNCEGFVTLSVAENIEIRETPEINGKIIRTIEGDSIAQSFHFRAKAGENIEQSRDIWKSKWRVFLDKRKKYIAKLPLTVATTGWIDSIPGDRLQIPFFERKDSWFRICKDWDCKFTGWVMAKKSFIFSDKETASNVVTYYFSGVKHLTYPLGEMADDPNYFVEWLQELYIRPPFLLGTNENKVGKKVDFKWATFDPGD